jgi:hypothetical protein
VVYGLWFMVYDSCCMYGVWYMVYGQAFSVMSLGFRLRVRGLG